MRRAVTALALCALVASACLAVGFGRSGANFTARQGNAANRFTTGDWVAPAVTLTTPASNARLDDSGKPDFRGAAGTATGDSTTVDVNIYSGVGTGGTLAQSLPVTATGATWQTKPLIALPDGTYTAQAVQLDGASNVGRSAAVTFTVDRTPPAPTITSPAGSVQAVTTLSGAAGNATGDGAVTVAVTKSGGVVQGPYTVTRNAATWTATGPPLSEGDYTATVSQSDDLGHTGTSTRTFTVDRTQPALTLTGPAAGATKVTTPVFTGARGTATGDLATVTVLLYSGVGTGGTLLQTQTDGGAGSTWSITSASTLADGTYTVTASQTDAAGNPNTISRTFRVDTVPPSPTVTAPTGYTSNTPTITGTAGTATGDDPTVLVEILSGAVVKQNQTVTVGGSGTWTMNATSLVDGPYTVRVTQGDSATNSRMSPAIAFTVDTTAPTVAVTAPAAGSYTKLATPALSGTAGSAANDVTSVTVNVYSGASATGTPLQTKTAPVSNGAWSVATSSLLTSGNGQYTVQATQSDSRNNVGTSTAVTFTYDTVAPLPPTVSTPLTWATSRTPTITGSAANGPGDSTVTVQILAGGVLQQTLTATRTGTTWTAAVPAALTEGGAYTAQAMQTDLAGNSSAYGTPVAFTVDTIAPAPTLTAPTAGLRTNNTTPALSGAAGTATADQPLITVRIYSGATATGTPVQTRTATAAAGAWTTTATTLSEGTYTAQASQSDAAGNTGTSTAVTFDIDTTRPTATNVTTTNAAGGTAGSLDAGDTISFVFSEAMDPASIVTGWNGTGSQAVTLNWVNSATNDWFSVSNAANTVHLATSVSMGANFLKKNWTTTGTLTRTSATTYTIALDATPANNTIANATAPAANIVWTPDTGAKDLAGNAVTAATFTQTDTARDF